MILNVDHTDMLRIVSVEKSFWVSRFEDSNCEKALTRLHVLSVVSLGNLKRNSRLHADDVDKIHIYAEIRHLLVAMDAQKGNFDSHLTRFST